METVRWIGLDVHAETIAVAVAERSGEVRSLGVIPNRPEALRKLIGKLGPAASLKVCYEAGPTGYVIYWQLVELGVHCDVVAPSLVPTKPGDRVKTDRRDALKLARCYRAGDLTPVWVPDAAHEALRDLVRAREAAKRDQLRARHRVSKLLLRQGRRPPADTKPWTKRYRDWLQGQHFDAPALEATWQDHVHEVEHMAARVARLEQALDVAIAAAPEAIRAVIAGLQALRGIAQLTAVTIVAEVGRLSRFAHPRLAMGYSGVTPREHSSGGRQQRGGITKTGNAHLRRAIIEAAWGARYAPAISGPLRQRQAGLPAEVLEIAWRAQHRLHMRYKQLLGRGKTKTQAITAVARELMGYIWAIGTAIERAQGTSAA
jgi:transposase